MIMTKETDFTLDILSGNVSTISIDILFWFLFKIFPLWYFEFFVNQLFSWMYVVCSVIIYKTHKMFEKSVEIHHGGHSNVVDVAFMRPIAMSHTRVECISRYSFSVTSHVNEIAESQNIKCLLITTIVTYLRIDILEDFYIVSFPVLFYFPNTYLEYNFHRCNKS